MLNNIYLKSITFYSIEIDSFDLRWISSFIVLIFHSVHIYHIWFNTNRFIQCKYIHSMQIYSFNVDIFIQCRNINSICKCIDSMQIYLFNTNFVYSIILGLERPSYMTYCVFRRETQAVKVDFDLSCK